MTGFAEHSVTANTVIGGLHPDAVHISAHTDGSIGIHVTVPGVYVALFGTLDDLVAVTTKLGRELARIAARPADPEIVDALRQRVEDTAADIVQKRARTDLPDPTITSFRGLEGNQ